MNPFLRFGYRQDTPIIVFTINSTTELQEAGRRTQKRPLQLLGYSVEGLTPDDTERLQWLYEACADYAILEKGELPVHNAAELEFAALPPHRTTEDKFIFGFGQWRRENRGDAGM